MRTATRPPKANSRKPAEKWGPSTVGWKQHARLHSNAMAVGSAKKQTPLGLGGCSTENTVGAVSVASFFLDGDASSGEASGVVDIEGGWQRRAPCGISRAQRLPYSRDGEKISVEGE